MTGIDQRLRQLENNVSHLQEGFEKVLDVLEKMAKRVDELPDVNVHPADYLRSVWLNRDLRSGPLNRGRIRNTDAATRQD